MHYGQYSIKKSSQALRHVHKWHTSWWKELSGLQPWYLNLTWIYGCSEFTGSDAMWRIVQLLQAERSTSWILEITCGQDSHAIQSQPRRTWWDDSCPWQCADLAAYNSSVLPKMMWCAWIQMHWRAMGSSSQTDPLTGVSMWCLSHLPWSKNDPHAYGSCGPSYYM